MGIFSSLCWEGVRFIPAGAQIWHIGKAGLHLLLKKEGSLEGFEKKERSLEKTGEQKAVRVMIRLLRAKIPSSNLPWQSAHSNNYQQMTIYLLSISISICEAHSLCEALSLSLSISISICEAHSLCEALSLSISIYLYLYLRSSLSLRGSLSLSLANSIYLYLYLSLSIYLSISI